jgi:putative aldouronate transport system substrate-binding protein
MSYLVLALVVALAGCSGGNKETAGNGNADSGDDNTKPVTYSYFVAAPPGKDIESNQTDIGKALEQQTGVNWKIEHVVGDVNTKIGTMIASNDYPDILAPDVAIDKVLDAGAFIPLNDLIDQYGPNIKRVYEKYFSVMKSSDGNIYTLPFSPLIGEYKPNPNIDQGAMWVQRRVLKEAGYPKIKTVDDYFSLIKNYVEKHKDEDLIGFNALTNDWRIFATTSAPMLLSGYPNDGWITVDPASKQAQVYADKDITKRWLQKLNEVNSWGLFDKSSFVDNYDQFLAKLSSGKVVGTFNFGWQIDPAYNNLKLAGNDDLQYFPLPVTFDGGDEQLQDAPTFITGRGVGITVSAKDPVRIIKFFDNLLSDENQVLTRWGIKGKTYEVDDKGRFYRTKEQVDQAASQQFKESFGFFYFDNQWPRYGDGSTLSDGNAADPLRQSEVAQVSYTDGDKAILAKYDAETFSDMFQTPKPATDRPWFPGWSLTVTQGSPAEIYSTKTAELQRKYFAKAVLASPGQFEAMWKEYVAEHGKLDFKAYEKTMNEEIQKRIELAKGS